MDVLESARFLDNCYVTAATSFWTCVAVITAALSFWRITAVGSRPHHKSNASLLHQTLSLQPTHAPPPPPPPIQSTPAVISHCCFDDDGGLTKTKFTVYYDADFFEDEESIDGNIFISEMCDCRINLPVVRTVDLGWYQCQDLMVLNGGVVRLWECEGRKSSPLKRDDCLKCTYGCRFVSLNSLYVVSSLFLH